MTVTDTVVQPAPQATRADWAAVPRVNLLPPEIVEARRFAGLQRRLVALLLLAVAACAGATWWAQTRVSEAQLALDDALTRTSSLQAEKAKYAEVPQVTAAVDTALSIRQQAMAPDVLWYRYLNDIALATSKDIWLTSMSVVVSGATPVKAGDPLAPEGVGTLQISGTTTTLPNVGSWMEALDGISGIKGSTLVAATREGESTGTASVTFSTQSVLTADALSHRYDRKAS